MIGRQLKQDKRPKKRRISWRTKMLEKGTLREEEKKKIWGSCGPVGEWGRTPRIKQIEQDEIKEATKRGPSWLGREIG